MNALTEQELTPHPMNENIRLSDFSLDMLLTLKTMAAKALLDTYGRPMDEIEKMNEWHMVICMAYYSKKSKQQ